MPYPAFLAASAGVSGAEASLAVAAPAGVAAGDFQICVGSLSSSSETFSAPPAGWTLLGEITITSPTSPDRGGTAWAAIWYSTTATGSSTFSKSAAVRFQHYVRLAWTGQTGVGAMPTPTATSAVTAHPTPSVTTTIAESLVIGVAVVEGPATITWTPPTGWTERYDATLPSTGTEREGITVADVQVASPGAVTGSFTSSTLEEAAMFAIVLNGSAPAIRRLFLPF